MSASFVVGGPLLRGTMTRERDEHSRQNGCRTPCQTVDVDFGRSPRRRTEQEVREAHGRTPPLSARDSGSSGGSPLPSKDLAKKKLRLQGQADLNGTATASLELRDGIPRSPRLADCKHRKLILHVDLRNTILVADSVTNVVVEQALNSFLTGVTWGQDCNGWCWTSDKPSLNPPELAEGDNTAQMTYYKFLERQLVRTPSERTSLRLATGDFTSTPIGAIFRRHFERHLKRLKWNYAPRAGPEGRGTQPDALLTMKGADGQLYHYILEGVYRLLHHLSQTNRDFAVAIRTYGLDAPNALASLAHGIKGNHPGFPRPLNLPVTRSTGNIYRPEQNVIILESYRQDSCSELQVKLTHERDIYRYLSASQGISAYKDDFQHWQDNDYNHHAGKPLWIDPHDSKHHHIIFDDNFRALDVDSIVDVRVFSKEETTRAYSLSKAQLSRLENVCLVQADLLESIDDRDYFLRKVELCEANYSHMLKNNSFPDN